MVARTSSGDGQMSARKHGSPSRPDAQRLGGEVDVDPAGQRERDDQRRAGAGSWRAPGDGCDPRSCGCPTARPRRRGRCSSMAFATGSSSGPRVADAGRAAVADEVEAELSQRLHQPGRLEVAVTTRDPGARLVLTVGPTVRPRATALRASSPAPTMTVGLRGVGAGGDGGDGHRAGADRRAVRPSTSMATVGVRSRRPGRPSPSQRSLRRASGRRRSCAPQGTPGRPSAKLSRRSADGDPVLRPARAGEAGLDGRQVELERLVEVGIRRPARATGPAPWRTPRPARPGRPSRPVRRR